MSEIHSTGPAVQFLHQLAHTLSAIQLYSPRHPAALRAATSGWESLQSLLQCDPHPIFLFLGGAPVYGGRALHEIGSWPWSQRLAQAGVQRLELDQALSETDYEHALNRLILRLSEGVREGDDELPAIPGFLFGSVTVEEQEVASEGSDQLALVEGSREVQLELPDEIDAMQYVLEQAREARIARSEAEAVTRLLGSLLDEYPLPQALTPALSQSYPAVHAVNTALIVMVAGSAAGLDRPGRHRLGLAALLHDIGMTRLPPELAERDDLTPEERALIETHTVEGASLLLAQGGAGLELAAVVAWEHHLRPDETGYPRRRMRMTPHWASRLTGTAAVYVALRSERAYRAAWSPERAVQHLESWSGRIFDPEAARLITSVVKAADK